MARGGKREGAGRPKGVKVLRTRIMVHDEVLEKLREFPGKTWNDRIEGIVKKR